MDTSIGVFETRAAAEHAFRELVSEGIPERAVTLLTAQHSSASAAEPSGRGAMGAYVAGSVGAGVGFSLGAAAATLFVPGIGPVLAIGIGAAALLGLGTAAAGSAAGRALESGGEDQHATRCAGDRYKPDAQFFRNVLKEGHSLVIVRVEQGDLAERASGVLDRLGMHSAPAEGGGDTLSYSIRQSDGISIVDLNGRLVIGEPTITLRELVSSLVNNGKNRVVFNCSGLSYVDSSGIGELVRTLTNVRCHGGAMRLAGLPPRIQDLLKTTKLNLVFDISDNENLAVRSFAA